MSKLKKSNGKYLVSDLNLKLADDMFLDNGETLECEVTILDTRKISDAQRKFIFALCGEIEHYTGNDSEYTRLLMQQYNANLRGIEVESLSKCSMTYANGLIDTIINFAIDQEVPLAKKILDDNAYKYTYQQVYAMTLKRVCVICGGKADIHHVTTVGMGNNRRNISHVGMEVLPLCRQHHTEAHMDSQFIERYHLIPIKVDDKLDYFIKKGTLKTYKEEV